MRIYASVTCPICGKLRGSIGVRQGNNHEKCNEQLIQMRKDGKLGRQKPAKRTLNTRQVEFLSKWGA